MRAIPFGPGDMPFGPRDITFGPSTKLNETCGVCHTEFTPGAISYNHAGATHDGFCKECLVGWLKYRSVCPGACDQDLDSDSLVSRTERIMHKLKAALMNGAYAAAIGLAVAGAVKLTGVRLAWGLRGVRLAWEVALGMGAAGLVITVAMNIREAIWVPQIAAVGTVLGLRELEVLTQGIRPAVALAALPTIAASIGPRIAMVAGIGSAVGIGTNWLFDRLGVDSDSRVYIGRSLSLGRLIIAIPLTMVAAGTTEVILTAIFSGIVAAGLSLTQR